MNLTEQMTELARNAKAAAHQMTRLNTADKNTSLVAMADAIEAKEATATPSGLTGNLQKGLPENCQHLSSPSGRQSRVQKLKIVSSTLIVERHYRQLKIFRCCRWNRHGLTKWITKRRKRELVRSTSLRMAPRM